MGHTDLEVGHLLAEVDNGEDGADVHGDRLGQLLVKLDGGGAVEDDAHRRHQAPAQKSVIMLIATDTRRLRLRSEKV